MGSGSDIRKASIPAPSGRDALAALRVLAVDDHPVNRAFLRAALRQRVARLDVVASGRDAIAACERQRFDVVLLDLHMPELDGFATWQCLRRRDDAPLAVALTADPRQEFRRRAAADGFRGYLEKPLLPEALIGALRRVARGERLFDPPGPADGAGPLLDDQQGLRALGRADRLIDLRRRFADELAAGLGTLERDLVAGEWDRAQARLHQWVGAGGYVGADRLISAAKRLRRAVSGPAPMRLGTRYLQFRRCAEATLLAIEAERSD